MTKIRSYNDGISNFDSHNKTLFLYYLGRYNNYPLYYYGETYDLYDTEFKIKKTLPYYKKITTIPVGDHVYAKENFDKFVNNNALRASIPIISVENIYNWDILTVNESVNIDVVLKQLHFFYNF